MKMPNQDTLRGQLLDVGFADREVGKALDWLEGLAMQKENHYPLAETEASASRICHA